MYGIVSLPDEAHCALIKSLWDDLEARFGLQDIAPRPIPHFSYQVAETYDLDRLKTILGNIAHNTSPFPVKTTGLGIFNSAGAHPVLYVPVIRDPKLTAFQRLVWYETLPMGTGVVNHYAPENWMPHISLLADNNLDHDRLPQVIRYLSEHSFDWVFAVSTLAVIHNTGEGTGWDFRIDFG